MRSVDIPPVWLALFLVVLWWLSRAVPLPVFGVAGDVLGWALVVGGAVLMALAIREFGRARTSVVPRREPSALVSGGVYRVSRNPIYLSDALFLAGAGLIWDTALVLPAVPLFVWVIDRRFVRDEEARLGAAFPEAFADWARRTRRWL